MLKEVHDEVGSLGVEHVHVVGTDNCAGGTDISVGRDAVLTFLLKGFPIRRHELETLDDS